jgi:hypothetical protein
MAYTKAGLRERLKNQIMGQSVAGTRAGQWSARKAQLLGKRYKEAGGGYSGSKTKAQRSLSKWSKQDWTTKSGKPSSETGERYLPKKAIKALSPSEYAATTAAKRKGKSQGKQFVKQPKAIAKKVKPFRR